MPSAVYEEPVELEIGLIEAGPPTSESYPYPHLTPTSSAAKRTFRCAVLENDFLLARFVPALGGRLLSLFDKRASLELLHSGPLVPLSGGRRGAFLSAGVELHLDGRERLNSLGPVLYAAEEPDEERPAGLWLSEPVTGEGTSWHLHATLPEDRAELLLEARVFNRSELAIPYSAGLILPGQGSRVGSSFVCGGLAFVGDLDWGEGDQDRTVLSRFAEPRMLAPRQLDTWTVSLIPANLERIDAVSGHGALMLDGNRLTTRMASQSPKKVVVLTADGQTVEAPLSPDEMALPDSPQAVAIVDPQHGVLLHWERGDGPGHLPERTYRSYRSYRFLEGDPADASFDVATRHYAQALLAQRNVAEGDYDGAERHLEQALNYNAEDHLAWWLKAVTKRLQGEEGESEELLNAHYLAPLEPALRAESFLAQPRSMEKAANPLLKPLEDAPEAFIEVAALLMEVGLPEDAARWIDEALRHIDLPILRYLLAYAHVESSGLAVEAADQVARAGSQAFGPPYPWRPTEVRAIKSLAARFPADARLQELSRLIDDNLAGHASAQG